MEWLNHIEKFENKWNKQETISVWEYIGKPHYKPINELSVNEITVELNALLELMQHNRVSLSTLCEVKDKVLYRFIFEELFQYEMDDMRNTGMQTCFTYEDFHPNAKLDIVQAYDYLLRMTFGKTKNIGGQGYDLLYIDTDNYFDVDTRRQIPPIL